MMMATPKIAQTAYFQGPNVTACLPRTSTEVKIVDVHTKLTAAVILANGLNGTRKKPLAV